MGLKNMKILGKLFSRAIKTRESVNEDAYYEQMFVNHDYWNKPEPNSEEILRWQIIEALINKAKLNKDSEILDLGCGRGWLSKQMMEYGKVYGLEPVSKVVMYGRKLFPEIQFHIGKSNDIKKIFGEIHFDLIVSSEVIEHVPDDFKHQFVQDIHNSLKNEGFVIITTPRKEEQQNWLKFSNPNQPIEDWITENEVEKLFVLNGFKVIDQKRFSISPNNSDIMIEIYQLWLFQKV